MDETFKAYWAYIRANTVRPKVAELYISQAEELGDDMGSKEAALEDYAVWLDVAIEDETMREGLPFQDYYDELEHLVSNGLVDPE